MHLFITGVTGFVGARLARDLAAAGDRASGVYLDGPAPRPAAAAWEVDLLDLPGLERALDRARPDAVLHLGGLSHVGDSWRRVADYFQVNVLGTENVLAAAASRGLPVLLASSGEVYGAVPAGEQPIAESRVPAPASPYAFSKAAAERLALARGATVVRCFNLIGAGQAPRFALPSFARQLAAIERGDREPALAVGNLEARRDFLHVGDGAAAYRLLAERGTAGEVYNLASGATCSIRELLDRLLEISGLEVRVELDPERVRPVDVPLLSGDAGRLRALGWRPRLGLDAALAELWEEARRAVAESSAP